MLANRVRMGAGGSSKIYGVEIDETNPDPLTSVVYTDAAVGFTPASGNNGSFSWGSWEDIIKNDFAIRPCTLKNNGDVNYYLNYDDYRKKADGTTSDLYARDDGNVMVEFGIPLWWKFERTGNKLKIQLSNGEFKGAIKPAFEIEEGFNLVHIYQVFLTQILFLLMFKNLNSQTALGRGRVRSGTTPRTGTTDIKTFCFGGDGSVRNIKFLGIEDYWGHKRWWAEGCYIDANMNILIAKENFDEFNNIGASYINYGTSGLSEDTSGFMSKVQGGNNTGFILASANGGENTYYSDFGRVMPYGLPLFGGHMGDEDRAGAFSTHCIDASYMSPDSGSRLSYSKNNKMYIGAYLGYKNTSNILLSRTNATVTVDTQAKYFRIYARNNNP